MKFLIDRIAVFLCSVILTELLERSTCFSIQPKGLSFDDVEGALQQIRSSRQGQETPEITLISFLQNAVKKYGEKKVAASIHELAQRSMYDLVWLLAGDLEPWLIFDFYKLYAHSSSDSQVLSVYERFKAGNVNRTIVPEVFALDKRYNEFDWWRRVRTRMLNNVDKYIDGSLKQSANPPPKIDFTPDGKPILAFPGIPAAAPAAQAPAVKETTTTEGTDYVTDPDDEDTDTEDTDLLDLFG